MKRLEIENLTKQELKDIIRNSIPSIVKAVVAEIRKDGLAKKWLSAEEAAKYLNIKKGTLNVKVSKKLIPHYKQGGERYFKSEELDKYIESGKVSAL